jgi:hypothetical protein
MRRAVRSQQQKDLSFVLLGLVRKNRSVEHSYSYLSSGGL